MYKCVICKKDDPDGSHKTYTTCDKCNKIICHGCTNLSPTELRVLSLSKRSLKYSCSFCENGQEKPENHNLREENKKLKQHISQLEEEIKNLQKQAINHLQINPTIYTENSRPFPQSSNVQEYISCEIEKKFVLFSENLKSIQLRINKLESINKDNKNEKNINTEKEVTKSDLKPAHIKNHNTTEIKPVTPKQKTQQSTVEDLEANQRQIMQDIINLEPSASSTNNRDNSCSSLYCVANMKNSQNPTDNIPREQENDKEKFIFPKNRKGYKHSTVIGQNQNVTKLRAVHPLSWLFISRLEPDTTVQDVKSFLEDYGVKIPKCFKINTFSNEIAAFKIAVQQSDYETVFSGDIWPEKTIIRPFDANLERRNFQRTLPASLKK